MKYNYWIDPIKRMFIPRPTKEENKRFDMAERTFSFPDEYFSKFMNTITQEDFITYPSYAEYDSLKEKSDLLRKKTNKKFGAWDRAASWGDICLT